MTEEITADGITVPLTHPGKVLFPGEGITKADLAGSSALFPELGASRGCPGITRRTGTRRARSAGACLAGARG